ncbi:MAG: L-threonylcarbamoyladenylate synthase [Candidatus Magasanikbacteria bacterium]
MKILKLESINEIIKVLEAGQVLVLPSETSYGLSCEAVNQIAVEKIFKIKGRASGKAVLVLVDSIKMAKKYLKWGKVIDEIAKKYWKENSIMPLTIVGEYKKKFFVKRLAASVISKEKTLAVRVTHHPFLKETCQHLGRPIVSTSANLAGANPLYNPQEIIKQFSGKLVEPEILVDAGVLPFAKPSTIVSVVGGKLTTLRQGELRVV